MPHEKFIELTKLLDEAFVRNGETDGFCFDEKAPNLKELLKKFERDELIAELKKRALKKTKASQWVPLVSQIDFMSRAERDVRLRFRNRIQSLRLRRTGTELARKSLETLFKELSTIEST